VLRKTPRRTGARRRRRSRRAEEAGVGDEAAPALAEEGGAEEARRPRREAQEDGVAIGESRVPFLRDLAARYLFNTGTGCSNDPTRARIFKYESSSIKILPSVAMNLIFDLNSN
jgi:hypothetical protein